MNVPSESDVLIKLDRGHVKVLRVQALLLAIPFIIGALVLEVAEILPAGAFLAPVALMFGWLVLMMPLRRYHARGYQMGPDRLRVVRGILFRSDTVVPFGRVQHLDVEQGPLERAFGVAHLVLHTAGTHNTSVTLPGLAHGDAMEMREEIRSHIRRESQ